MSTNQTTTNYSQPLGDGFKSVLTSYQPKSPLTKDFKVLTKLTEYRDYKFSNGFYHLTQEELQSLAKRMTFSDFELLLDQLFGANPELYSLFRKVLMNESSEDDYRNYMLLLETTGVMKYNYSRLYGS